MPYRTELDTLRARRDVLRASLREVLEDDERTSSERELDHVAARLRALDPGARSLLDRIGIATPCDAKWDAMTGDDRVRHCGACDKTVYDLSALTSDEAEALLAKSGALPCVRLHRRRDGTVLTADCARGRRRRVRHIAVAAAIAAGAAIVAAQLGATARHASWQPLDVDRYENRMITMGGPMMLIGPDEPPLTPEQRQDAWLFQR